MKLVKTDVKVDGKLVGTYDKEVWETGAELVAAINKAIADKNKDEESRLVDGAIYGCGLNRRAAVVENSEPSYFWKDGPDGKRVKTYFGSFPVDGRISFANAQIAGSALTGSMDKQHEKLIAELQTEGLAKLENGRLVKVKAVAGGK